jgi:hypothetical protein
MQKTDSGKINITMYPNPSTGTIFFDLKDNATYEYTVTDITGKLLFGGKNRLF